MSQDAFEHIKAEIDKVLDKYGKEKLINEYETGNFARAEKVKDLQVRFNADLAYGAGLNSFFCSLYREEGLNDSHIQTALKAICPKITRKY